MADRMRMGVVFGGRSAEHEVSVVSAIETMKAADPERFEVVPIGVTGDGRWLTPEETQRQVDRDDPPFRKRMEGDVPPLLARPEVLDTVRTLDFVFPLVHGVNGEDGTLQGMLEMFGVPYAGCGVAASAIGMDKALQKEIFVNAGLEVSPYVIVLEHQWQEDEHALASMVEQMAGYPAFVKPSNGGSSVGVSKVRSREDLGEAMRVAFGHDRKVVVEEAVQGREVECGVIGNDRPEASPVGEIIPGGEFYDYAAKYLEDTARLVAPAELPEDASEAVRTRAIEAYTVLDCQGFARVDFFLPDDGDPIVNEINTLPGFTPISMFPRLWDLAGLSYRALISKLVDLGLERFRERERRHA